MLLQENAQIKASFSQMKKKNIRKNVSFGNSIFHSIEITKLFKQGQYCIRIRAKQKSKYKNRNEKKKIIGMPLLPTNMEPGG